MRATQQQVVRKTIALLGVLLSIGLGAVYASASVAAPESSANVPSGIQFAGAYTPDDVAYFQDNLAMLHAHLPKWWQTVRDARPFTIAVDPGTAQGSIMAVTECCGAGGSGTVKFGYHLRDISAGPDAASQTAEARQITFLGMLVHELTHVRDLRAGRFALKTDRKSCTDAEGSGLSQQLAIKRDLAASGASANLTAWLAERIRLEMRLLHSRPFWDLYCGSFE